MAPGQALAQTQFWNQSHIDQLNQELPRLDEDQVLYHWADPRRAMRWIQNGAVDEGEVQFLNKPSGDRQVHGPGIYLSEHPTNEKDYGEMLVQLKIRKGTPVYNNDVITKIFGRELSKTEQSLLGNHVGYVRKIGSNWWTIHSASAARDVSTGIAHRAPKSLLWDGPVLMKAKTPVTLIQNSLIELRDADPKTFGYATSFSHLARYQDGISFLRSVQVNPQDPWSEFENGAFENYRLAREDIYRRVHKSWKLTDYGEAGEREPRFVRTERSPIGISEDGIFELPGLGAKEWAEKQVAILSRIRGQVSGNADAPNRGNRLIAAGDEGSIVVGKKQQKAMRVTESQLDELKANRFLKLQVQPDVSTGYFNVTIEYPSVYQWQRLKSDLDPEFARELGDVNLSKVPANSEKFKTLNQKFLDQLLHSTFRKYHGQSLDRASELMKDLISIHPGADFNGRSIRLYLEAAEIESNRHPGYHFLSDLDLFTTPEAYRKMMKSGAEEYALFQARALTEVVAARNEGRVPNLHLLQQDGETLRSTFGRSLESVGLPIDGDFSHEQSELIRQRNWTKLLSKFGSATFDLSDPVSWQRAFNRYVKGTSSGAVSGFKEDILKGLPALLKAGVSIDDESLRAAIAISPAKIKLEILKSSVEAKGISVATRLSALTQLMKGKPPQQYLKGRPEMLRLVMKERPDTLDEKSIVALTDEIRTVFQHLQLSDFPEFTKILEKYSSKEVVDLYAGLILNDLAQRRSYSSLNSAQGNLLRDASKIYFSKSISPKLKQGIRAEIRNHVESRYIDGSARSQILSSLNPKLRDEIAIERLTRDAFNVNRQRRAGRAIKADPSSVEYYRALSDEAKLSPEVQRAERILAREQVIKTVHIAAPAGADEEAAIAQRAEKELRSIEGLLEVCDRKKRCEKAERSLYQTAWHRLRWIDPNHPRLLNFLSWRPEDVGMNLDWGTTFKQVLAKAPGELDQTSRLNLTLHLANLISSTEDRRLADEVLKVAAHHGVIKGLVIEAKPSNRLTLSVPEDVAKELIAEHGLTDPRIERLISRGHIKTEYVRNLVLDEVRAGRLQPADAFKVLPSLKKPNAENAIELITAFKNYPDDQATLIASLFSVDRTEFVSAYGILKRFEELGPEVAKYYRFTFSDIDRALRSTGSVSPFGQSRLMSLMMEVQPELFDELNQKSKDGEDVTHWVRALGGEITKRDQNAKIIEQVLKNDKEGKYIAALAADVGSYSAADKVLRGRSKEELSKLEKSNPKLLGQLTLTDRELMESVLAGRPETQVPVPATDSSVGNSKDAPKEPPVDVKTLKPRYIRLCLANSIPADQCRASRFAYRYGSSHNLSKSEYGVLLEMALMEGNFDFISNESILSKLYDSDPDVSAEATRKLLNFLDKNPNHPLNSFYAHIFIERSSGSGRIFLSPAEQVRLSVIAYKSKGGLGLTKTERAMDATFRMIGNPITGTASKIGRGCSSAWETLKAKLK